MRRENVECKCGCGRRFSTNSLNRVYFDSVNCRDNAISFDFRSAFFEVFAKLQSVKQQTCLTALDLARKDIENYKKNYPNISTKQYEQAKASRN